ncbi:MAG: SUMF1/EgtB/PvdO family nonheme iron enzyme [Planctomycetia bacterium]|nr:SUMF1/EgtB/PvdO family nonheme iron enzyme [Planctomycetia bacterium]
MRQIAIIVTSLALVGSLISYPRPAKANEKLDAAWKELEGSWRVQSAKAGSQELPMNGVVYTLGKEQSSLGKGGSSEEMKCTIFAAATPFKINLAPVKDNDNGINTMHGIYKIDGNTLTICWAVGTAEENKTTDGGKTVSDEPKHTSGKRPTKFTTEDAMLMTLSRVEPTTDAPATEKPSGLAVKDARTWHNLSGRPLEAALVKVKDDGVVLRRASDSKEFTIPLSTLSVADRAFLKKVAETQPAEENAEPVKKVRPKVALKAPKAPEAADRFNAQILPIGDAQRKAFNKEREGKWVEVTGWVNSISVSWKDPKAKPTASLAALNDEKKGFHRSNVDFNRSISGVFLYDLPWLHFSFGSEVTLRGIMNSKGQLDDARIISVKGEPVECFSPEELVALYDKSPEDFDSFARDKDFIVKGRIADFAYTDPESQVPYMQCADGAQVRLFLINRLAFMGRYTREAWWKDVHQNEELAIYGSPGGTKFGGQREFLFIALMDCTRFPLEGLPKTAAGRPARHAAAEKSASVPKRTAAKPKVPKVVTNSIGMKLTLIPAGEYVGGTPDNFPDHWDAEHPRRVRITQPFYMGVYEVTQAEYQQLMGNNPSQNGAHARNQKMIPGQKSDRFPVDSVSWKNACDFCQKLSDKEGKTYRLPTEGEWEHACRAGTKTLYHYGDSLSAAQANIDGGHPYHAPRGPSAGSPVAVGSYRANAFGLYDMHGNVSEWCEDYFDENYILMAPVEDPPGPAAGLSHVIRGGGWESDGYNCRSTCRAGDGQTISGPDRGFRVVLEIPHAEDEHQPLAKGSIKPIKVAKANAAGMDQYVTELREAGILEFDKYNKIAPSTVAVLNKVNGQRASLGELSRISGLLELRLEQCNRLAPKDFGLLVNFKELYRLNLKECAFTDGAMPLLAEIPTLNILYLEKTQVTEKGLAALPPGLKHLQVFRTQFAPGAFKNLAVMPKLDSIIMEDVNIDDDGLAGFAKQPSLATIQIMRGKFTDKGLEHLKAMPKLDNLWLRECPGITDAGLVHLQAIPKLRLLMLKGSTNVTPDGLKALRKARPDVDVSNK